MGTRALPDMYALGLRAYISGKALVPTITYILLATTLGWNATGINITPAYSQHFNIFQACDHCCTRAAAVCQILHTMLSGLPP